MESQQRFYIFTQLIDGVHKCIHKLKLDTAPYLGVKSVHIFWVYELYMHPEGLTAAELASRSMISRSLISREIESLQADGYIEIHETAHGKRKNYNSHITLTESGRALAQSITKEALAVQEGVRAGISDEELAAFYATLEKLYENIKKVTLERETSDHLNGTQNSTALLPRK
ncbi:MAG: winged helix-turn-helix transcriptional regulator [Clostridia bacterium]|nr:winged helix-turn-helix transcriptional regulator [Clostridia bacterium]